MRSVGGEPGPSPIRQHANQHPSQEAGTERLRSLARHGDPRTAAEPEQGRELECTTPYTLPPPGSTAARSPHYVLAATLTPLTQTLARPGDIGQGALPPPWFLRFPKHASGSQEEQFYSKIITTTKTEEARPPRSGA